MQGPTTTNPPQCLLNMVCKPCHATPQPQPPQLQLLHHASPPHTSPTVLPPQHGTQAPPLPPMLPPQPPCHPHCFIPPPCQLSLHKPQGATNLPQPNPNMAGKPHTTTLSQPPITATTIATNPATTTACTP